MNPIEAAAVQGAGSIPRDTHEPGASPRRARGRAANTGLWVVQVLLAALYGFAGINKLLALQPEAVQGFAMIGLGDWFRYFTGALELAGAIGLLIPRVSPFAALLLACVMLGAIVAHLVALPPAILAVVPAVLGLILLLIARARRADLRAR